MFFEIIGDIKSVEVIAKGRGVRSRHQLSEKYGPGRWRKLKGIAKVRFEDDTITWAEVHWYEATGIGKKDFKVKRVIGDHG